jgi:hypothetical protein
MAEMSFDSLKNPEEPSPPNIKVGVELYVLRGFQKISGG